MRKPAFFLFMTEKKGRSTLHSTCYHGYSGEETGRNLSTKVVYDIEFVVIHMIAIIEWQTIADLRMSPMTLRGCNLQIRIQKIKKVKIVKCFHNPFEFEYGKFIRTHVITTKLNITFGVEALLFEIDGYINRYPLSSSLRSTPLRGPLAANSATEDKSQVSLNEST
jgi:hypothetical protein